MKMKKLMVFLCAIALVFTVAGNALATPITLSDSSLQSYFNTTNWELDAVDDQMGMPEGWTLTNGSFGSMMTFYHEDFTEDIAFGIYSLTGEEFAEVFDGGDTPVASAAVGFDGEAVVTQWYNAGGMMINQKTYSFTGQSFGFYIATGTYGEYTNTIYSDSNLNDLNGNGTYGEDDDIGLLVYNAAPGSYIFAGDMDNDRDFSDIVTQAESITPVPEPSTVMLVGTGLLGMIAFGRKRFNKKA
jgi:hypothetical protein